MTSSKIKLHGKARVLDERTKLKKLQPVLDAWVSALEKYMNQSGDKYPWNYRERSWVGFLAAGAWLVKGVALEEWRTDKRKHDGNECKGRADLYIGLNGDHYDFEAKHGRWNIGKSGGNVSRIRKLWNDAGTCTGELTMKGSTLLPTVFASVHFPKTLNGTDRKKLLERSLEDVITDLKPSAYAYVLDGAYENGIVLFLWKHRKRGGSPR